MKHAFLNTRTLIGALAVVFCLLAVVVSQAAESSSEAGVKPEAKEQYRQEILGKKGDLKTDKEYVIGYRDILYVEVYGEGSMAIGSGNQPAAMGNQSAATPPEGQDVVRGRGTGAEVGPDGRVSLRHIGDVYVVGMTLGQCSEYLKKLYSTVYDKPTVITALVQSNSRQFTVMGQVKTPGLYHLDVPMTIVKGVARAGGFNEWANSKVTVIRQANEAAAEKGQVAAAGKTQRYDFDYDDFLKGKNVEKNIELEPGDVVVAH